LLLEFHEASLADPLGWAEWAEALRKIERDLASRTDLSYALSLDSVQLYARLSEDMRLAPLERAFIPAVAKIVTAFPEYEDLPDELPESLRTPHPLIKGDELTYAKTEFGFVLYSPGLETGAWGYEDGRVGPDSPLGYTTKPGPEFSQGVAFGYRIPEGE
jgi:hypothetical protein